jgi:acyl-CoA hydrolase
VVVTGWLWNESNTPEVKVADAYLTFVAVESQTQRPLPVPALRLTSAEERENYLWGQWRYLRPRKARA